MGLFSGITKFIRNFADDVLGLDPNGGGIYSVFDNVLGIDPNGGGVFTLFKDLGIKVDAQDFYKVLNQAISQGLKYVIVSITGVPVQIDIDVSIQVLEAIFRETFILSNRGKGFSIRNK